MLISASNARRMQDGDGWELLDWDPATGISRWLKQEDGITHLRTDTPVDKLVRHNAEWRNEAGAGWQGDWHKIASTPADIFHGSGMDKATGQQDLAFVNRWLADNSVFKTHDGRA